MVQDTELTRGNHSAGRGSRDLDVDRFYSECVLEPKARPGYSEAVVCATTDDQLLLCFTDPSNRHITMKSSTDRGRSWGEPSDILDVRGKPIEGCHMSVILLAYGGIGMVHSGYGFPGTHPGRDGGTLTAFRTSGDNGRTWSAPVLIDDHFALCCSGHALVLPDGRILAPSFKWVSPIPGNDAEAWVLSSDEPSPTLSYSFVYVSDDAGKTWARSLSELFISVRRAAYDLEEPAVIQLKDGRLLMHLRSQTGRMYRAYSEDRGISWSRPEGLPIAAAYTPSFLCRLPSFGDLLMIWNQASRQEIMMGLQRHRLSCAISKDEGQSWENFKNLESLDDTTTVPPPPVDFVEAVQPYESYGYHQPSADLERYHRAPGVLRICYPSVAFVGDEAVIVYDYGLGTLGDRFGAKLRAVPLEWFTEE